MLKKVVIVNSGKLKDVDYGYLCNSFKEIISDAVGCDQRPIADVKIVDSVDEAEKLVKEKQVNVLIFVSGGMSKIAHKLKAQDKNLEVYVLSGVSIEGEPFIIPKSMIFDKKPILAMIM